MAQTVMVVEDDALIREMVMQTHDGPVGGFVGLSRQEIGAHERIGGDLSTPRPGAR